MCSIDLSDATQAGALGVRPGDFKLEAIILPVADVDRALDFYARLGWRLDADFTVTDDLRVVQLTPPGSLCSVTFGRGITTAAPGSVRDILMSVHDIDEARAGLLRHGVEVSEPYHYDPAVFHRAGLEGRLPGPDPEGRSYSTWASWSDPDGNTWLLQEIKDRLPGR